MIEDEIFYPTCKVEDDDRLEGCYVEHDGAKVLIAELLDNEPEAEFYDAKVIVLSEMIKASRQGRGKALRGPVRPGQGSRPDTQAIGERLRERKQALMESSSTAPMLPPPHTGQLHRARAGAGPSGERRQRDLT
jgi:hypothetical protein